MYQYFLCVFVIAQHCFTPLAVSSNYMQASVYYEIDSSVVSLFDWLSLTNRESEANPKNNLMMKRAGLQMLKFIIGTSN